MFVAALLLSVPPVRAAQGVDIELFGSSTAGVGDVDRDGLADVATVVCEGGAEYGDEHDPYAGLAAFSGLDGRLLWRGAVGMHSQRFCKRSLRSVGDVDRDGLEDVAFLGFRRPECEGGSHPVYELEIDLLSGRDGSTLWSFHVESGLLDAERAEFACLGDLDADSIPDLAVVACTPEDRSVTWILSCKKGEILRRLDPDPDWWASGYSLESAGDFDGDGCADLTVTAYSGANPPRGPIEGLRECVLVRSSRNGSRLLVIEDRGKWSPSRGLGIGDVDGDGHGDLAAIGHTWGGGSRLEARIYSGSDGRLLGTMPGLLSNPKDGDLISAGDVDRDGRADLLFSEIKFTFGGRVRLFSARDGKLLRGIGPPPYAKNFFSEYFGYSLAAAGDVDADGVTDWIVGQCSPWGEDGSRMVVVSGSDGRAIQIIDRRNLPRYPSTR